MRAMQTMMTAVLCGVLLAGAGMAAAQPPLREVDEIDDNMMWVAIAYEISDECAEIDARIFKGLAYLNELRRKALELGYSSDEIKAYHGSDAEKARMRRKGEAYMRARGLDPGRTEDICALGHAEIARNSMIGTFLKAK